MQRRVRTSDYSWFDVSIDDDGNVVTVIESRVVWSLGKSFGGKMMSERIRRAIELAKKSDEE